MLKKKKRANKMNNIAILDISGASSLFDRFWFHKGY